MLFQRIPLFIALFMILTTAYHLWKPEGWVSQEREWRQERQERQEREWRQERNERQEREWRQERDERQLRPIRVAPLPTLTIRWTEDPTVLYAFTPIRGRAFRRRSHSRKRIL